MRRNNEKISIERTRKQKARDFVKILRHVPKWTLNEYERRHSTIIRFIQNKHKQKTKNSPAKKNVVTKLFIMRKSIYRIKIHINLTSIFIFLLRWNIKFVLLFMALLERVRLSKYCGDLFEWCIGWHHLQLLHISTSRVFIFIFICSYILFFLYMSVRICMWVCFSCEHSPLKKKLMRKRRKEKF